MNLANLIKSRLLLLLTRHLKVCMFGLLDASRIFFLWELSAGQTRRKWNSSPKLSPQRWHCGSRRGLFSRWWFEGNAMLPHRNLIIFTIADLFSEQMVLFSVGLSTRPRYRLHELLFQIWSCQHWRKLSCNRSLID